MIDPTTGKLVYDNCQEDGAYGDVMTVNGKQQPFHEVGTRKYRFRVLNASDARQYWLALRPASRINDPSADIPFLVIGSDHGLLAAPKPARRFHVSPAERVEIVVDFAGRLGQRLVLVNTLVQTDDDLRKLAPIMAFDVTRAEVDESTVPPVLSEDHVIQPPVQTRSFRFDRSNSLYTINSLIWNPQRADAKPVRDTVERWRLVNNSGGWGHPIHLHLGKAKIVGIDGRRARPDESGWKDTLWVGPNQTVTIDFEFYNFGGRFAFHCHNASHEDHDMMSNFQVQPVPPDGI